MSYSPAGNGQKKKKQRKTTTMDVLQWNLDINKL